METNNQITHSGTDIKNCLQFIVEYRKLESLSYDKGSELIKTIFSAYPEHIHQVSHLLDQWKWKKKDFGSFYLNLGAKTKVVIYSYFGITDPYDVIYLDKIKTDSMATLFAKPSNTYRRLNNVVMFFNNHGINPRTTEYLTLSPVPAFNGKSFDEKNPSYGNSKNWGKYILSLPEQEQIRIIEVILNNYQTDNYNNG